MDQEEQSQSIQARIAALNIGHVGRAPITATQRDNNALVRPELDQRSHSSTVTTSPSSNGIGNEPNGPRRDGVLPPPAITRTGQKVAQPKPTPPPRLPPRKHSTQPSPALPPRRPSQPLSRRDSNESIASTTSNISSISALSNDTARTSASRTPSMDGGRSRAMAPAFDATKLPPLPPKRAPTQELEKGRVPLKSAKSTTSVVTVQEVPLSAKPPLPSRAPTQEFAKPPPTRRLPPRDPPSMPARAGLSQAMNEANTQVTSDSNGANGRAPPPIPAARAPPSSSVLELTPDDFNEIVLRSGKAVFVDFYMPWCKYCKELDEVYPDLAASFAHAQDRLVIAKIDVRSTEEGMALGARFNLQGYPSLRWFDGQSSYPVDYPWARDLKWMSQFIEEKTGIKPQAAAPKGSPPIPLSSRPDISKILATKPKPASLTSQPSSASCLICRDFSAPDAHAANFPRHTVPSLDWLANQLTSPFPSFTDKARAIFTWLHHNIEYDTVSFFNNNIKPSTPAGTLQTGLAVCEGYAALFTALASKAGLESVVISGHGKGFSHKALAPRSPIPPESSGHAWNGVKIDDGEWKLIDPCWGAGNVSGKGKPYNKDFTPRFFTMSNNDFGLRHFPSNKSHFFRTDGRAQISWEEYIVGPDPSGAEPVTLYGLVGKEGIAETSFMPKQLKIPVNSGGMVRFQFSRVCPHWDPLRNGDGKPFVFFLSIHGIDGREDDKVPFETNGGSWWADVEARRLGARGQSVTLYTCDSVSGQSGRGLSVAEFRQACGKKAMGFGGVAKWELV